MKDERRTADLVAILRLIEEIGSIADSGLGSDERSNSALGEIKSRVSQLADHVRASEGSDAVDVARLLLIVQQIVRS